MTRFDRLIPFALAAFLAGAPPVLATPILLEDVGAAGSLLASHPDGGFLLAWTDPEAGFVRAQRLGPDGTPGAVISTSLAAGTVSGSTLVVAPGGAWLLAGRSAAGELAGFVLSPAGAVLGELDLAVPEATSDRSLVAAAMPGGGWVVAWAVSTPSDFGDGPPQPMFPFYDTYAARYDATGERVAGPVRINVVRAFDQDPVDILAGPETIVVAWYGYTGETRLGEGTGRVLGHDLAPRSGEIQLNPERFDFSEQRHFSLVPAPGGGFLAAWTAFEGEMDGSERGDIAGAVRLQVFAADGSKIGPDRLANVVTAGHQDLHSAAVTGDGTVWLLWTDFGVITAAPLSEPRTVARPFSLDGLPLGSEVEVVRDDRFSTAQIAGGASAALVVWREEGRSYAALLDEDAGQEPPPDELALTSPELPGFRAWVRYSAAGGVSIWGTEEPLCIAETLCASGALPGRTEVLVRVVGPKPNGYLWPTLVKLSTSQVEVWLEQLSTGEVQFYLLPGASPGHDVLPGLFDRDGFRP